MMSATEPVPPSENREHVATATSLGAEPISEDAPGGWDPDGTSAFEAVSEEIAKLNHLVADPVDWPSVVSNAQTVLRNQAKDLRISAYLARGWYEQNGLTGLADGLDVLIGVVEHFWQTCWPKLRRLRGRASAVTWLIDRVTPLLRERFVDHDDAAVLQRLDAQADMLERLLADLMGEYAPDLANLRSVLATKLGEADPGTSQSDNADTNENVAVAEQRGSGTATADHRPSQVGRTPSGRATDSASPANALDTLAPPDPASDRAVKRVFTEAAAALRPGDPDNPLFYHMVRYAIWRGIEDLPNARADGRTYLSPLPPDRVAQYEKQLSAGHYADVINHVETSVARNPFWIDGHRFTVDALTALGHTAARDAVVYEVRAFLTRLPGLLDLSFNDGTPFASATTAQWLREYALGQDPASEPKRLASINGWREILQTAREDAREPGELLGNLERGLLTQSEPRARFLWGLALANACLEAGHPALAEAQLARLSDQYEALGLAAWEPSLGQDLETALATVREHTRARTGDPGPVAHNSVQASRPRSEHPSEI